MDQQPSENIIADYYDNHNEVQKEILAIELKKVRNKLFILAAIILASDFLGIMMANTVTPVTIGIILVIPVIMFGLAFLSAKEPIASLVIATLIMVAVWTYIIIKLGSEGIIKGALGKVIVLAILISAFHHAKEAARIKKELAA